MASRDRALDDGEVEDEDIFEFSAMGQAIQNTQNIAQEGLSGRDGVLDGEEEDEDIFEFSPE